MNPDFTLLTLPAHQDPGPTPAAVARWHDSREQWRALMAGAPDVRDSIRRLIHQRLGLDPERAGLGFLTSADQPERFVSLTHCCAFVLQQPEPDPLLDQRCVTVGLTPARTALTQTPAQVLDSLKRLDVPAYLRQQWDGYWDARASGTALSRRAWARELFHRQAEAAGLAGDNGLDARLAQRLSHSLDEQLASVRQGAGADLATHGTQSLEAADRNDQRRRDDTSLAPAPALPEPPDEALDDAFITLGDLPADLPLSLQRRALKQQQDALEQLFGDAQSLDLNNPRLLALKTSFDALMKAARASHEAATALFRQKTGLLMLELRHQPNPHYSALLQGRRDGLRAEADIQLALKQITPDQWRMLQAVLDDSIPGPDVAVATLTLQANDNGGQQHELTGALLITHPQALNHPTSPHAVLLYWPGSGAGLQGFASRQALTRSLFKIADDHPTLALQLKSLSHQALAYSLQTQLYACELDAAELIRRFPGQAQINERVAELEKLRERTLLTLQVPTHGARDQAFALLLEQWRSGLLAEHSPAWLSQVSSADRSRLKTLTRHWIDAMQASHALLERDLPQRDDFARLVIDSRLRRDFSLQQAFDVQLDLPESVTSQKELISTGSPGTPYRLVPVASPQRGRMSLPTLLLNNIDAALRQRMAFMQVVISADRPQDRDKLSAGIDVTYLSELVRELDLAQHYEERIRRAFMGSPTESAFSQDYRRECLIEPWRRMLQLQGEYARLQAHIQPEGLQRLTLAIDADTPAAWQRDGQRLALRPAYLSSGGEDTRQGPSTLSGVTFIEEAGGITLLYLPEAPDGRYLYQYANLETARQALFDLCLRPDMVHYLAGRTLQGEVASHISRINQARQKNFAGLIGVGLPWPATTSLAAHLLNVHMGRLIEAHRATSRSNTELQLERYALESGKVFNYLKMAIGMVPFVGTAVALYDAWNSANQAVAAFRRNDIGQGLDQIESVLLSLIDAAMDILPGVAAAPARARALTRQRQWRGLGRGDSLRLSALNQARWVVERFAGYQYEQDISLTGLRPGLHGIYCNVYRHARGDFIVSQGRIYKVELSDSPRTWRLSPTRTRSYKQPIALDDAGQWQTHGALYGTLIDGGLSGGGNLLGHMADGLDPLWPAAIRQRLPRWWTDRVLRRQQALDHSVNALNTRLQLQSQQTNRVLTRYNSNEPVTRLPGQPAAYNACAADIELAMQYHSQLEELASLSHGNKRTRLQAMQSQAACIVVNRSLHRLNMTTERIDGHLRTSDLMRAQAPEITIHNLGPQLRELNRRRQVRLELLREYEQVDVHVEQANQWNARVTSAADKAFLADDLARFQKIRPEVSRQYVKNGQLLELVCRHDQFGEPSWFYLHEQMKEARSRVESALYTQNSLPDVVASRTERIRALQGCIETYEQFNRQINAWTASYPQHFDLPLAPPLIDGIARMAEWARAAIRKAPPLMPQGGKSGRKLFVTEDDRLLAGIETIDPGTQQKRFEIPNVDGHVENWVPGSANRYRLQRPAASTPAAAEPVDINALLGEARQRLEAQTTYVSKVEGYARQHMLPADLEHLMLSEARELEQRAQRIERRAAENAIIETLRRAAIDSKAKGRTLRIRQCLDSKTPTEGYLDYLLDQNAVDIRKVGALRPLGRRPDGRPDFLQEYEIRDLAPTPPTPHWYAHFHYESAQPKQFDSFTKAHLKLPEQRELGLHWQQAQAGSGATVDPIWRGDIRRPLAVRHFSPL